MPRFVWSGSLLVAVACVWALPEVARAEEICHCEVQAAVLPARGAREVPRNTKIWTVNDWRTEGTLMADRQATPVHGESVSDGALRLERYSLPSLEARHAYQFDFEDATWRTEFTTSDEIDLTPPSPPRVASFAITQVDASMGPSAGVKRNDYPVTDLALDATFDRDTALLRVELIRRDGSRWSTITTPDGIHRLGKPMCDVPILDLSIGDPVVLELRAIDLAGNESEPVRVEASVTPGTSAHGCARAHWRCGMGDLGLYLLAAFVFAVVVLSVLVLGILRWVRGVTPKLGEPAAISLLVVEQIARTLQRRGGVLAALALAGVPATIATGHELLAVPMTILTCVGIRGYALARGVLWRIEGGDGAVAAAVHGTTVYLRSQTNEIEFEASERIIARARTRAVPGSIVKPPRG